MPWKARYDVMAFSASCRLRTGFTFTGLPNLLLTLRVAINRHSGLAPESRCSSVVNSPAISYPILREFLDNVAKDCSATGYRAASRPVKIAAINPAMN